MSGGDGLLMGFARRLGMAGRREGIDGFWGILAAAWDWAWIFDYDGGMGMGMSGLDGILMFISSGGIGKLNSHGDSFGLGCL